MINEMDNFSTTEHSVSSTSSVDTGQTKREANDFGDDKPVQLILQTYRATSFGTNRSFSSQWFIKYRWLEYSVRQDKCYYYPCRKFLKISELKDRTFTAVGCNK